MTRVFVPIFKRFWLMSALLFLPAGFASAAQLDVDLSKPDVQLDVSFEGSELLLFGAKQTEGDIIVVVRGPQKNTSIRLKERIMGVWVSTDEVIFENAPTYYALAATKPIDFILPKDILEREKIGAQHLGLKAIATPDGASEATIQNFRDGLIRNMVRRTLYSNKNNPVDLVGKQLFRTNLWFPANVHVGHYAVDTYLVQNGKILIHNVTDLQVHKVGLEAELFSFAHEHALIYGLLAILIAVVAGWSANAVFKKRG